MGKTFSVQFDSLEGAASSLKSSAQTYREISKSLMTKATTMGEAWQGDDNLKYVEQIKVFSSKLEDMAAKLELDAEVLTKQKTNYENMQQSNITNVSKLKN